MVGCQFCERKFDPLFILKHIGKSKDCKLFYGPDFERLKREKHKIRMSAYRRRIGNEKAREKYQTNSDFREKKKMMN